MKLKIVTDSTSDLPPDVRHDLDITVVPLHINFGAEAYLDGVELSTDQFYQKLQTEAEFPKTSTPSPAAFAEVYSRLAQKAGSILSIHISHKLSGTSDAARIAAQTSDVPVRVIDSESASTGLGLLTVLAARAAKRGGSLEEVEALVEAAVPHTIVYGLFDTLEYLHKGGRIGRAQAFMGSLLKIKPIIAIQHGAIVPVEKARTRARGIDRLCELVHQFGTPEALAVMESSSPQNADPLLDRISQEFSTATPLRSKIGPVIGSHVGPGAIGVSVIRKAPGVS